jgi:AraC-like DNA-binding protein
LTIIIKGDGIFVNTNQLHFGAAEKPDETTECVFRCLRLNPSLLCAHPYIENRFVNPLLYDGRFEALFFPAQAAGWCVQALLRIKALMELTLRSPDDSALEVQSRFFDLLSLLYANTVALRNAAGDIEKAVPYRDDLTIKRMVAFIQKHYNEKITLNEIAYAGPVCRSKCCRLFKQTFKESVFDYLLHFRIRKSLNLLTDKTLSITAVSSASGFSAASYYGEIFKRILGMIPGEYRRKFLAGGSLPQM